MSLLERFRHRGRNPEEGNSNVFQATPQEEAILDAFMPEERGGFKGFSKALDWSGISPERQRGLLEEYHVRKPKAMRPGGNNQFKA